MKKRFPDLLLPKYFSHHPMVAQLPGAIGEANTSEENAHPEHVRAEA